MKSFNKKSYNLLYKLTHKEELKLKAREYYKNSNELIKAKRRAKRIEKLQNDELFKCKEAVRSCIKTALKKNGYSKNGSRTENVIGLSTINFKLYIESKFEPWMTWENYGKYNGELNYGWDIDHIIPISLAKTEEEIIRLNHYINLQPLCSKINRDIKRNYQYETH